MNLRLDRAGVAAPQQIPPQSLRSVSVRHLRRFLDVGYSNFAGQATFVGPTAPWEVNSNVVLSAAWNIQVVGRAQGVPGNLDLVNFNRHLAKAKLAVAF